MDILEAIEKIESAVHANAVAERQRAENLYDPIGLEEQISILMERSRFNLWALGRLCAALKEERQEHYAERHRRLMEKNAMLITEGKDGKP